MTIASALDALNTDIQNARTAITNKGGTVTANGGSSQLATDIATIPTGGGTQEKTYGNYYILDDDTIMPFYIYRMTANGASLKSIIITDGLTDYDDVGIVGGYKIVGINSDVFNMSFVPTTIKNVFYDDSKSYTKGVGIKKFVLKSITGNFICYNHGLIWAANNPATALTLKTIDLSNATSVTFRGTFVGFSALEEVILTSAININFIKSPASIGGTFKGTAVSSLSFPALTTTSFIGLQYAMNDTGTDIVRTLHFPSNLETTIQGLSGYPLFGGTSGYVTLAFDLPATE